MSDYEIRFEPDPDRKNGCVPLAVHAVTGIPYDIVDNWLFSSGYRKSWKGGTSVYFASAEWQLTHKLRTYRFTQLDLDQRMTVGRFERRAVGTYIVEISRHWLSIVDGIIHDTRDSNRSFIKRIWRVEVL